MYSRALFPIIYSINTKGADRNETNIKTVIAVLVLLGVIKTVQTHDVITEADEYYQQMKSGQLLENISNYDINQVKDIDLKQFSPSDFF